jgi:ketosteroid isomerase-like protein
VIGTVEHELIALSRDWMRAAQEHDRDRLEILLAREFSVVGAAGDLDRAAWLERVAELFTLDEFAYDEIDVEVYGDTAVLSSRYRQVATLDGRDLSGEFLVTDVWIRRDGRWQVVRRHATPAF